MRALLKTAIFAAAAASVQAASATCYMVYAPDESVVFRSLQSPVDLSKQLHTTMAQIAPRGTLIFSPDNDGCEVEVNKLGTLHRSTLTSTKEKRRAGRIRKNRKTNGS